MARPYPRSAQSGHGDSDVRAASSSNLGNTVPSRCASSLSDQLITKRHTSVRALPRISRLGISLDSITNLRSRFNNRRSADVMEAKRAAAMSPKTRKSCGYTKGSFALFCFSSASLNSPTDANMAAKAARILSSCSIALRSCSAFTRACSDSSACAFACRDVTTEKIRTATEATAAMAGIQMLAHHWKSPGSFPNSSTI